MGYIHKPDPMSERHPESRNKQRKSYRKSKYKAYEQTNKLGVKSERGNGTEVLHRFRLWARHHWTSITRALESLCVSSISLGKLVLLNDREKGLADGVRASADHLHLGDRGRGKERLEEPEDPGEERRNVDEELARLSESTISQFPGVNSMVRIVLRRVGLRLTRNSG